MGNYISLDEFAKYLADIQYGEAPTGRTGENIDYQEGVYAGFDMAYVALKQFPAADVRPVVRGEWVEDDYGFIRCSNCGMEWDEPEHPKTNYCPNCGADMREKNILHIQSVEAEGGGEG